MGLDIKGKESKLNYSCSYSGLHLVRWLALRVLGAPKEWKDSGRTTFTWVTNPWIDTSEYPNKDELMAWHWALQQSGYYFPNLMFHNDAEGSYTPRGKVFKKDHLMSGNSKELLAELVFLKENLVNIEINNGERSIDIFNMLFELVKDEVENGKGVLNFC